MKGGSREYSRAHILLAAEVSRTAKCLAACEYEGPAGIRSGYTVGVSQTDAVAWRSLAS